MFCRCLLGLVGFWDAGFGAALAGVEVVIWFMVVWGFLARDCGFGFLGLTLWIGGFGDFLVD